MYFFGSNPGHPGEDPFLDPGATIKQTRLCTTRQCYISHFKQLSLKKIFKYTVKPVLRGHCIKGSPVLSSHFSGSLEPKYNANEPVLRGHLS